MDQKELSAVGLPVQRATVAYGSFFHNTLCHHLDALVNRDSGDIKARSDASKLLQSLSGLDQNCTISYWKSRNRGFEAVVMTEHRVDVTRNLEAPFIICMGQLFFDSLPFMTNQDMAFWIDTFSKTLPVPMRDYMIGMIKPSKLKELLSTITINPPFNRKAQDKMFALTKTWVSGARDNERIRNEFEALLATFYPSDLEKSEMYLKVVSTNIDYKLGLLLDSSEHSSACDPFDRLVPVKVLRQPILSDCKENPFLTQDKSAGFNRMFQGASYEEYIERFTNPEYKETHTEQQPAMAKTDLRVWLISCARAIIEDAYKRAFTRGRREFDSPQGISRLSAHAHDRRQPAG